LIAVDAKVSLDDNGLYRQPELQSMRDLAEESPLEVEASRHQLNYIKLDGNIACLVNGAGLAMATMDIIQHYGGRPANFLGCGWGRQRRAGDSRISNHSARPACAGDIGQYFWGHHGLQCDRHRHCECRARNSV
jgi:succinyl-CoA synthetase beta subunit